MEKIRFKDLSWPLKLAIGLTLVEIVLFATFLILGMILGFFGVL